MAALFEKGDPRLPRYRLRSMPHVGGLACAALLPPQKFDLLSLQFHSNSNLKDTLWRQIVKGNRLGGVAGQKGE